MREISEQQIAAMAPNANAVSNTRKIIKSGGFTEHTRSENDTFYMDSYKRNDGSAYRVTLGLADNDTPMYHCSCPSRQFPCKHGLALMMELSQGRRWDICDILQDILGKRTKKSIRAGKKEGQGDRPRAPKKTNQVARTKKLKKQLEGLDLAEEVVRELVEAELGVLSGTSVKVYQDLAKQLRDYYLPGPQRLVQSLVLGISRPKEDGKGDYREAVRILVFLRALIKESRVYLTEELGRDQVENDTGVLCEELDGVWDLDGLIELELKKESVRLLQLFFHVSYDGARRELVDKDWWLDLDGGEIDITYNYRPVKALKYVREEDSVAEALRVLMLVYHPGGNGRRIRWEGQKFLPVTGELLTKAHDKASSSLPELVKAAKNKLKNTLSDGRFGCLISYGGLGTIGTEGVEREQREYIICCGSGTIELKDRPGGRPSVCRLDILSDKQMAGNQVMFGVLWYDRSKHGIYLHPCSIITAKEVVRLLY